MTFFLLYLHNKHECPLFVSVPFSFTFRFASHVCCRREEHSSECSPRPTRMTFTQREDMPCLLGEELRHSAFLLEEHAAADRQVRPSEQRPPCCPRCQNPGDRVTKRKANLPRA